MRKKSDRENRKFDKDKARLTKTLESLLERVRKAPAPELVAEGKIFKVGDRYFVEVWGGGVARLQVGTKTRAEAVGIIHDEMVAHVP